MKAVYFEKHGGPDVLKYGPFKDPSVDLNDVLIEVAACALNHLDIWVRQGLPGVSIPLPHIPGSDVAGTVLETGKGVRRFKKGDRVIVSPGQLPPNSAADGYAARDSYSPDFQILGLQTQGGYAERVAVNERFVIPVSEKYSLEEWASVPLASLTAYHMLVTRANVQPGETVLVHAAGSGIGSAAVQIAKFLGATVYTTVGDYRKVARAKKLGADEVILYKTRDFSEAVKELTGGRGVDVIFEHIGPETWQKNLSSLARGGRMVTCGATSGPKTEMDIRYLFSKQISILGAYMGSFAELLRVIAMVEKGALVPTIDQVMPLKDAAAAHKRMESRQNFGKIVLKV
ncbi:MAG: alcohol dehydrogenase [Omnitrophica bacterium RIFCSPHIGHO2_02_FULL_63_14]|nr:MAG: alcohol dehydrogenase [Omnitrophica bacterium RIFCSPHIGHO2_02_FULL_63_14]